MSFCTSETFTFYTSVYVILYVLKIKNFVYVDKFCLQYYDLPPKYLLFVLFILLLYRLHYLTWYDHILRIYTSSRLNLPNTFSVRFLVVHFFLNFSLPI